YQQLYQSVKDTLLNQKTSRQIAQLQVLYEIDKKQKQIQLLQAQTGRQKILRNALIAGITLAIIIGALLLWLQIMKHRKDKMIQASQQALIQEKLKNSQLHE